ncbi:co-chaperone GroES [Myroides odoratimimus]|uniref:co-chaperone GroES n=1 Tax=Myroides odoratimimus TaxID=76832 RepID=UPI002575DEA6|nr:co-chaperone GroES [Myroides odoratimimus]MDM1494998.1 co-chaperone GroES [Myroides odoratimimus]MDM1499057.1 co-chaperone GroES [Myroides odoratimimus]MDM1505417.1 co-chaperone GroES [Myroides odoratimimus]MDM1515844.1 co-chaperone GroES [Myroides odoratimimus]
MQSIKDFIIYSEVDLRDTFKTESGLELFADKRFSQKLLANREVIVQSIPLDYTGENITGWQAFIDPTIYFRNNYNHGKGDNLEIPGEKGCYKVQPNMIIAVRKDSNSEWIGFENNLVVEPIVEKFQENEPQGLILGVPKTRTKDGYCKVIITNNRLDDILEGDTVLFNHEYGVDVYLDSKKYLWIRVKDCLAKVM